MSLHVFPSSNNNNDDDDDDNDMMMMTHKFYSSWPGDTTQLAMSIQHVHPLGLDPQHHRNYNPTISKVKAGGPRCSRSS